MTAYITRRVFTTLLIAVGISILVFLIVRTLPGDPARIMLGIQADETRIETLREELGLDKPIFIQYGIWLNNVVHGDLGSSVITGQSVSGSILNRLPVTFSLALSALFVALLIAIPAGTITAVKRDSYLASIITVLSQIGVGIPNFWLGILFILVFAQWTQLFPSFGYEPLSNGFVPWARHLALPALSVGLISGAIITRFVRSAMLEALNQDFIKVARAKGLRESVVVFRHTFKNAIIPIVTVVGLQLAYLLSGVVVIEVVFALPGLGRLAFNSVTRRDYPMLQGAVLTIAISFTLINLLVDVLYAHLDPRIKY
ncbi:MAG: ABC transporter permease [Candidatus Bipolaricaulota bacterium]